MIDWWGVTHNALWVLGLALALAVVSMASYRARVQQIRLRAVFQQSRFQLLFNLAMTLFCLGLLFSSRTWWEQVLWVSLALVFGAQAFLVGRGMARDRSPSLPPGKAPPSAPGSRGSGTMLGCLLILAGLLVVLVWAGSTGWRAWRHGQSLRSHLNALQGMADGGAGNLDIADVQAAGEHLATMRQDLAVLESIAAPFLPATRWLAWVPRHGGDLAAAPDLLALASGVMAAGDQAFGVLAPGLALIDRESGNQEASSSLVEEMLPVLLGAQTDLSAAQQDLEAAILAREALDDASLSPLVGGLLDRLDRYLPWFQVAIEGGLLAPEVLGANGPRTYLVLAQNNWEMRATGGFISGVAQVTVDNGRLGELVFSDSHLVDNFKVPHEVAPVDFYRTLYGEIVLFRDANWDPDFPTSAQRAMDIYARDQGIASDGVIALDLHAVRLLVGAVEPLQVEGIEQPLTARNLFRTLQDQWGALQDAERKEWIYHRKDFMGQIARAVVDKLMSGEDVDPARAAWALRQALDEKHMLVYLDDPQAVDLLRRQNWDGALASHAQPVDTLMVVDSNVGFDKMDARIERAIDYHVDLSANDGPRARLEVRYSNPSSQPVDACVQEWDPAEQYGDMMQGCYWDYVRVYVPSGSELVNGPDLALPPGSLLARDEKGPAGRIVSPTLTLDDREVWTAFFALAPLGEQTLIFEYKLPARVLQTDGEGQLGYRLAVQKQPGSQAVPFEFTIVPPPATRIIHAEPEAWEPSLPWATDLRTDREIAITLR